MFSRLLSHSRLLILTALCLSAAFFLAEQVAKAKDPEWEIPGVDARGVIHLRIDLSHGETRLILANIDHLPGVRVVRLSNPMTQFAVAGIRSDHDNWFRKTLFPNIAGFHSRSWMTTAPRQVVHLGSKYVISDGTSSLTVIANVDENRGWGLTQEVIDLRQLGRLRAIRALTTSADGDLLLVADHGMSVTGPELTVLRLEPRNQGWDLRLVGNRRAAERLLEVDPRRTPAPGGGEFLADLHGNLRFRAPDDELEAQLRRLVIVSDAAADLGEMGLMESFLQTLRVKANPSNTGVKALRVVLGLRPKGNGLERIYGPELSGDGRHVIRNRSTLSFMGLPADVTRYIMGFVAWNDRYALVPFRAQLALESAQERINRGINRSKRHVTFDHALSQGAALDEGVEPMDCGEDEVSPEESQEREACLSQPVEMGPHDRWDRRDLKYSKARPLCPKSARSKSMIDLKALNKASSVVESERPHTTLQERSNSFEPVDLVKRRRMGSNGRLASSQPTPEEGENIPPLSGSDGSPLATQLVDDD
jgi:hypothetical protein